MDCIILFRNTQNGRIGFVSDERGDIAVFANRDAAIEAAGNTTICEAFPFQIIEADEL